MAADIMRIIIGDVCMALAAGYTFYIIGTMLRRTRRIVARAGYLRVFRYELLVCLAFLALAADLRFDLAGRTPPGAWRALAMFLRAAMIIFDAFILLVAARVQAFGRKADEGPADCAVVLGAALEDGRPTRELIARVDAAAAWASARPEAVLIVTGGNPAPGSPSEAEVMRDLLVRRGVAGERVRLEDRSTDTRENFLNVARMVDPARPMAVVTSGCHMLRAAGLARGAGFARVLRVPARDDPARLPANVLWEVICVVNGWLTGEVPLRSDRKREHS